MAFKISTLDMRQGLGDILNRVSLRHDQFIIERKGRALAALVPMEKFDQMRTAARAILEYVLSRTGRLSRQQADEIADAAKRASRKHRGRT